MEISCFSRIISVDSFFYALSVDNHEWCRFSLYLPEDEECRCAEQLSQSCECRNSDGFYFRGTVTEVSVQKRFDCIKADLFVQGKTIEYDKKRQCRVFQDKDKKVSDIFRELSMPEVSCRADNDAAISRVIVQDHETDWEFAKRILHTLGQHIFPGDSAWAGEPAHDSAGIINENDIIAASYTVRESGRSCTCRLKRKLSLGARVNICGFDYFVASVIYRKDKEVYDYEYRLLGEEASADYTAEPVYTLRARVTDNEDPERLGRVKVEYLAPYKDIMRAKAIWTDCDTVWASKGFGVACVPLAGDTVLVRICGDAARVVSALRTEAFDERFTDPKTRYLFLGKQTYLSLADDKLLLSNSRWTEEIGADSLKISFGEKAQILAEDGSISLTTDKCSVKAENDRVYLGAGSSGIELSGDIKLKAKELSFALDAAAAITAANVNIKGKSGVSIN